MKRKLPVKFGDDKSEFVEQMARVSERNFEPR